MHITVTREEIDQTNELLELLRRWEPIRKAGEHYDGGAMAVQMTGNNKAKIEVVLDQHYNQRPGKTPVEKCQAEISAITRGVIEKLGVDVCAIIKKHMPIPLES